MYTKSVMEGNPIEPMIAEPETPKAAAKKAVFLSAEKVTIVSICAFLFLLFSGIVVVSQQNGSSAVNATPTPVPDGLFQVGQEGQFSAKNQQQVQGAQTQQKQQQVPPMPTKPPATPSPSATATPSPTPTPSPSPSPSLKPEISDIQATPESNKATIKWKTNKETDYLLVYWKESEGTDSKKAKDSTDKKTEHSVDITGLDAGTKYKYKITSKDGDNNAVSSEEKDFTTP